MKIYTVTRKTGEFLGEFIIDESSEVAYGYSDDKEYDLTSNEVYAIVKQHRPEGNLVDFLRVKSDGTVSHLELIKQ